MDKQISQELVTFIKQSPTAFHAVFNCVYLPFISISAFSLTLKVGESLCDAATLKL